MPMAELLVLQLLIPLGLLTWLVFGRARSRAGWVLGIALVGGYLAAVALAGLWLILPPHLPVIYLALFVVALVLSRRALRASSVWPTGARGWAGFAFLSILTLLTLGLAHQALSGRHPPDGPVVDLAFPLRGGRYSVVNGGSTGLVNAHLMTLTGERYRPYRGQSYGVDLVRLDPWGFRARGLAPKDPAAYAIFGDPVYAPCPGRVIQALDGLPDLRPPQIDREHMAGNHVLLECGDAWVLLGHLRKGSVRVREEESVAQGQEIGRVGNTGNTNEPHLHIHAQRPGTDEAPFGGDPLPIRLDGRYLPRNARIVGGPT